MISTDTIKEILSMGVLAPSGENAQPWRFELDGEKVPDIQRSRGGPARSIITGKTVRI